jgi:hypothetical protein
MSFSVIEKNGYYVAFQDETNLSFLEDISPKKQFSLELERETCIG